MPRQGIESVGSSATGTHDNPPPPKTSITPLSQTPGCPSSTQDLSTSSTQDDTTHRRSRGTIRRALHYDIDRDQATWFDQGSLTIRVGGWLNSPNPQKLRRAAGTYILYPVPHGMDDHCPGLRPGDPPSGHPCPQAVFQPLPPQPAPLPGIYLNTATGAKRVYLTAGDTTGQAVPLDQVHGMAMGQRLPSTDRPRHLLAGHSAYDPRLADPNAPGPDKALVHLTMEHTAQLPTTLAGEKTLYPGRPNGRCHHPSSQHPGGRHGRLGRCRGTPHGT